ncbi:M24 family metallopeptidase [Maritimibacter alkaliphilus]|uniref:M24 family metallopeptidase n=1 Tax=Maritimibacter alkaliphilus TaxID=404236 RepID=UPI001C9620E7|nr:Xaa-Pro peptidase family protein [Maritimibacter alkaliphilus]MBY6088943.1 Xaa-Pro peptidase family protein [Maritimibacter alkaliphilus]
MANARLQHLKDLTRDAGLDYFVLFIGPSLRYFTGLQKKMTERPTFYIVNPNGKDALFISVLERDYARNVLGDDCEYHFYTDLSGHAGPFAEFAEAIGFDGKQLAMEYMHSRVFEHQMIMGEAPNAQIVDGAHLTAEVRMCKDASEIEKMRRAIEITEASINAILPLIKEGATERQISLANMNEMISRGSELTWKFPSVISGARSAAPHNRTSDRPFEKGDIVMIDTGAVYEGYTADITRTFALGSIDPELEKAYEVVKQANEAVMTLKAGGMTASVLDQTARDILVGSGYEHAIMHRTGHGIGMEGHEAPYIAIGNEMVLREGFMFTVEPGLYFQGKGGIRIEDNVVIANGGLEQLTTFTKDLMIL